MRYVTTICTLPNFKERELEAKGKELLVATSKGEQLEALLDKATGAQATCNDLEEQVCIVCKVETIRLPLVNYCRTCCSLRWSYRELATRANRIMNKKGRERRNHHHYNFSFFREDACDQS